ncbi:Hsp20/alpha crystallin family protein [Flavobacterium pedocola]
MGTLANKKNLFPSMNSFFDDVFAKDFFDWNDKNYSSLGSTLPSVNLMENETQIKIDLAAPGMQKKDFNIELKNDMLTISSERKYENEEKSEKDNYMRKEFSYQSFCRSFYLPDNVKKETIDATYKDGILHVEIQKQTNGRGSRSKRIEIH